ncbi:hypothetical protein MFLAVUS_009289 [Mucor flavus]|uniref:Uncharacterized protein n=1 Tax=Mucor flavus TaxID=439312 RepID=A0ABP9Z9N0_9FUNG
MDIGDEGDYLGSLHLANILSLTLSTGYADRGKRVTSFFFQNGQNLPAALFGYGYRYEDGASKLVDEQGEEATIFVEEKSFRFETFDRSSEVYQKQE